MIEATQYIYVCVYINIFTHFTYLIYLPTYIFTYLHHILSGVDSSLNSQPMQLSGRRVGLMYYYLINCLHRLIILYSKVSLVKQVIILLIGFISVLVDSRKSLLLLNEGKWLSFKLLKHNRSPLYLQDDDDDLNLLVNHYKLKSTRSWKQSKAYLLSTRQYSSD